jgi:DNA-binding LacI/PurR family transcriptional regulator
MGKRRVRLSDIAERAGVSATTVSLVLNDKAANGNVRISDQTIKKVRRTALSMGYRLLQDRFRKILRLCCERDRSLKRASLRHI